MTELQPQGEKKWKKTYSICGQKNSESCVSLEGDAATWEELIQERAWYDHAWGFLSRARVNMRFAGGKEQKKQKKNPLMTVNIKNLMSSADGFEFTRSSLTAPRSCKQPKQFGQMFLCLPETFETWFQVISPKMKITPARLFPNTNTRNILRLLFSSRLRKVGCAVSLPPCFSYFHFAFIPLFISMFKHLHVCHRGCSFQALRSPPRGRSLKQTTGPCNRVWVLAH